MRISLLLGAIAAALSLSACGSKSDSGTGSAKALTTVAAPAGTKWSETVAPTTSGGFVMGNPNAALKVVEYGSFTCPHCRDFTTEAHEPLASKFVDNGTVSYEFRPFVRDPLDMSAALVASCGGKDVFFPVMQAVFANQETMYAQIQARGDGAYQSAMTLAPQQRFVRLAELAGLIEFAKQHGLPETQVRTCLANSKTADALAKSDEDASKKYNIMATPTFILNGTVLENVATWPNLEAKLKEAGA